MDAIKRFLPFLSQSQCHCIDSSGGLRLVKRGRCNEGGDANQVLAVTVLLHALLPSTYSRGDGHECVGLFRVFFTHFVFPCFKSETCFIYQRLPESGAEKLTLTSTTVLHGNSLTTQSLLLLTINLCWGLLY